jgi:hypothetical protein
MNDVTPLGLLGVRGDIVLIAESSPGFSEQYLGPFALQRDTGGEEGWKGHDTPKDALDHQSHKPQFLRQGAFPSKTPPKPPEARFNTRLEIRV